MWKSWEPKRCLPSSTLIVGMKRGLVDLLRTCTVRTKGLQRNVGCTKRFFNIAEKTKVIFLNARLRVRYAIFPWWTTKFIFVVVWPRVFVFPTIRKTQFNMLIEKHSVPACFLPDKSVFKSIHRKRMKKVVTNVRNAKRATTFRLFFPKTKNRQFCCLAAMALSALSKKPVVTTTIGNRQFQLKVFSAKPQPTTLETVVKNAKFIPLRDKCIDIPLVDTVNKKIFSILNFWNFILP